LSPNFVSRSDWYTGCLEGKLSDACVGLVDYTHAKLYHTVQEYYR